jgi:hypothetical protein
VLHRIRWSSARMPGGGGAGRSGPHGTAGRPGPSRTAPPWRGGRACQPVSPGTASATVVERRSRAGLVSTGSTIDASATNAMTVNAVV